MTNVKPIPDGMHALTPHLICANAPGAIDFYKQAFGATEESRMPGPDGKIMHASIRIGDSVLFLMEEAPNWSALGPLALKGSSVTIHHYVADADATFSQAVSAGAKPIMPPADMFWGDRYGVVEDPSGHRWAIATHKRDLSFEEMMTGMKAQNGS